MAGSTYSTNLKIELMTTGENSGTWGDITNTNLGTALEQAVVGYGNVDYVADANLTISITNSNASQPARALVLNVTSTFGSLTQTRELVVPTSQKQYIVQNNTTGGQSITVKTSAGTGITVPNGRKAHLYVNGTSVIQMFDFINILGGTIDNTTLGATTASSARVTTLNASGATTLDGTVALGNAAGDIITVPGTIGSNLIFTDNTYDIGASGATRPRNLFLAGAATIGGNLSVGGTLTLTGGVNLNGNVTVGDSAADTLTINSTVTSNLIFTDNTYDIGASGATRPRNLFIAGNITAGGNQTLTGSLTVDSTTDTSSATTGSIQTDGGVGIAKGLYVGGNTTLGDASADTVTVNGTVTSNLIFTDNTYDIGASGATRPRNLFLSGSGNVVGTLFKPEGSFVQWNSTGLTGGTNRAIVWADSSSNLYLGTGSGNSTVATFNATGVGIGTAPSTSLQVAGNSLVGVTTTGGMGAQTGLTVVGGATVNDNTPGALTLGSHLNARTVNSEIGKIDFYSNDASGGASGVQASIRAVTETAIGESAGLRFYTGTAASLGTAGSVNYLQQWGLGSGGSDGNFRLTLTGAAGDANGLSIFETSTGNNARLRLSQESGAVNYNATFSSGGNYHLFRVGNTAIASITNDGVGINAGSTAYLTGSLGSRLWTPGLAIGTGTYSGLYGPSLTYLADKSGSSWVSNGGGTAGALGIDEGHFYFARSNGVGAPGAALTWTTYLSSDSGGNFSFDSTGFTKVASGTTAARPTATAGRVRWNTTLNQFEVADGANFEKVVVETLVTSASGGTITTDGDYKYHTFTSSGTFTLSAVSSGGKADLQVLVVGGGGGGGRYLGGGGGAGAMLETIVSIIAGTYTVTVGAGGAAATNNNSYSGNGSGSSLTGGTIGDRSCTAFGGGGGGNGYNGDVWGANGSSNAVIGSGGGGGSPYGVTISNANISLPMGGPAGRYGSGGAFGTTYTGSASFTGGGGGGGAFGPGVAPNIGNGPVGAGGFGGSGMTSTITGSTTTYYGGGGGGGYGTYLANQAIGGGAGGGGYGVGSAASGAFLQAAAGTANTGGGGGGGQSFSGYETGGNGGSGIVIIRYKFQ